MDSSVQLEHVPGQIGTAILEFVDGKILTATGELSSQEEGKVICSSLFKILQDSLKCLDGEPLRRISVSMNDFAYVMTASGKYVYIVKVAS